VSSRAFKIERNGDTLELEYCGNGSTETANAAVRTVVVVVHGSSRNHCDYASYTVDAASKAGTLGETLVVAPHFLDDSDITKSMSSTLYWSNGGWKDGSSSLTSPMRRPWTISSFEALDRLIASLTEDRGRFPGLNRIVVAGHSAGGQFTNRYAAGTRIAPAATSGIERRYVVANPSSYLYFDSARYNGSTLRRLTGSEAKKCSGYDDYKYGLQDRNKFMGAIEADALQKQYVATKVTYLLGDRDNDPNADALDTSCEAKWQGANRLERGKRYHKYLGATFGSSIHARHGVALVPGVGHEGHKMLASRPGQTALFG